jgi:lipopolysaccharide transport system ATP-binding protein
VVFVSHNMNALQRLCPRSILLDHGRLMAHDETSKVIEQYLSVASSKSAGPNSWIDLTEQKRDGTGAVRFTSISYCGDDPAMRYYPQTNGAMEVSLELWSRSNKSVGSIAVVIFDRYGTKLVNADTLSFGEPIDLQEGKNTIKLRIDQVHLNPGLYTIGLWVADPPLEIYDYIPSAVLFEVVETEKGKIRVQADGLIPVKFSLTEVG